VRGCCGATAGSGTLDAARRRITEAFGSVRAGLDAREEELKAMVDALADEKLARANEQLHELGMHRSRLHAAKECADATIAMAPGEVSARFKLCLDTLHAATATSVAREPVVDARIPVSLPVDGLLDAIASFGAAPPDVCAEFLLARPEILRTLPAADRAKIQEAAKIQEEAATRSIHAHPVEPTANHAAFPSMRPFSTTVWNCDGCLKEIKCTLKMPRFRCTMGCDFDLCTSCKDVTLKGFVRGDSQRAPP
jgi:hypothetical protein